MKIVNPAMDDSVLNMTPMIDIVFQLILFFLFSLKFKDMAYRFDSQLPTGYGPRPSNELMPEAHRLTVTLSRLDEIDAVKARTKIKFGGGEWIVPDSASHEERDATYSRLRDRIAQVSKATSVIEGEIKTPLPSGASVPHADVMKVLDVFWELKLTDVKFEGAPSPLPRVH